MIMGMPLVPDRIVIPDSSGSLQMVDHTLLDVPSSNVYLDSRYYRGQSTVVCVISPVARCCQTKTGEPNKSPEFEPGSVRATTI